MNKTKPYVFNETVLHVLSEGLKGYIGQKVEIADMYILHNPELSPRLVMKLRMDDGTVLRVDKLFFEDEG